MKCQVLFPKRYSLKKDGSFSVLSVDHRNIINLSSAAVAKVNPWTQFDGIWDYFIDDFNRSVKTW